MSYNVISKKIREIEKEISKYWDNNRIIDKVLRRKGERKFYFLDGPPYVTERIHIGTAWNKVLKDCILRYKRLCGYKVWAIPGYDTHGLPIEVAVERQLGIKNKKEIIERVGIDNFNKKCIELVKRNMNVITSQFKNLAVWMDWDNPYVTYRRDYISSIWWILKRISEKNLLGEDLRVFHWCPRCETVLSEHEVSMGYKDVETPSIYVKFPVANEKNTSFLIWTTTPWTLPSNVAIAVHPDYTYALVELRKTRERLIIMEARIDKVIHEEYKILSIFYGKELAGKKYISPLKDYVDAQREVNAHYIILSSEYVSPEEGTGLVHIAPEHGKEDFELGKEYNLPIITLVDNRGYFTRKAGKYAGLYIFDADNTIVEDLRKLGYLYKEEKKIHRYPFCWRCHTPLFMKTTKQWIIKLSQIKDKLISENRKVLWVPKWAGEQRFGLWLETARDWVITRQRYWGTPAPIWRCEECGYTEVIGGLDDLIRKGFHVEDLHRPYIDQITWSCPECGGIMRRIPDVLDVWIDSGAAPWASINYPANKETFNELWPVDFITEGHDQTRGWFYAMLCLGVAAFDECPYRTVLVHGFTLDEQGRGMHKSLGNVKYPEEFIEKYGVDPFRIYLLSHTIWEDMLTLYKRLNEILRILNIIINTYEFYKTYAELDNYKYKEPINTGNLLEEDLWILSKFETVLKDITKEMDKYYVHNAIRKILEFIVEDLSRKYIKLVRRRVWIEEEDPKKTAVYDTLHYILKRAAIILSPFAPHLSEYLYSMILSRFDRESLESVHLETWPQVEANLIYEELTRRYEILWDIIAGLAAIRQKHKIKNRQPLKEAIIPQEIYDTLSDRMKEILLEQANIREIKRYSSNELNNLVIFEIKLNYKVVGPKHGKKVSKIEKLINRIEKKDAINLLNGNQITLSLENEEFIITPEDVTVTVKACEPYDCIICRGFFIFLNIKVDKELLYEGIAKDIVRRIQQMRKDINLNILDQISVFIETSAQEILDSIEKHKEYIMYETRAKDINISKAPTDAYTRKWNVNGKKVSIAIQKI